MDLMSPLTCIYGYLFPQFALLIFSRSVHVCSILHRVGVPRVSHSVFLSVRPSVRESVREWVTAVRPNGLTTTAGPNGWAKRLGQTAQPQRLGQTAQPQRLGQTAGTNGWTNPIIQICHIELTKLPLKKEERSRCHVGKRKSVLPRQPQLVRKEPSSAQAITSNLKALKKTAGM